MKGVGSTRSATRRRGCDASGGISSSAAADAASQRGAAPRTLWAATAAREARARRGAAPPKKAPAALATMRLATASLMIIEVAARSGRCEQDFSAHCQHDEVRLAQPGGARGRARRR